MAQWLRCCAINRKVAGSIPDGVIGIFHWHNPSDRTMALGSTQPGGFPGGKCRRCVKLTTLPPSCAVVMKSGNLNFLEPSGPLQACNGTDLHLPIFIMLSLMQKMAACFGRKHSDLYHVISAFAKYTYSILLDFSVLVYLMKDRRDEWQSAPPPKHFIIHA